MNALRACTIALPLLVLGATAARSALAEAAVQKSVPLADARDWGPVDLRASADVSSQGRAAWLGRFDVAYRIPVGRMHLAIGAFAQARLGALLDRGTDGSDRAFARGGAVARLHFHPRFVLDPFVAVEAGYGRARYDIDVTQGADVGVLGGFDLYLGPIRFGPHAELTLARHDENQFLSFGLHLGGVL